MKQLLIKFTIWVVQGEYRVLLLFERFAHRLQRLTGSITCYDLAALAAIGLCGCYLWQLFHKHWWFAIFLLWWLPDCFASNYLLKQAYKRLEQGLANPWKSSLIIWTMRVFFIGNSLMLLGAAIAYGLDNGILQCWRVALIVYFKSCDPLPPCRGKIREWLDSLSHKLVPVKVSQ